MSYTKADFKIHLASFKIEGFKNIDNDFVFINKNSERALKIEISNNVYFPNSMVFKTIITSVIFNEFEKEFSNIWNKYFPTQTPHQTTISYVHFNIPNIDYEKIQTRVIDDTSYEFVCKELKKLINLYGIPFLEKYNNLQAVADLYAALTPEEVSKYIQGSSLFIKAILLLRESNHIQYESKKKEYYDLLCKYADENVEYKKLKLAFEETF
jgi:hypothetical protein